MRRFVLPLALMLMGTNAIACSTSPSWSTAAAYEGSERIVIARILSYRELEGQRHGGRAGAEAHYAEIEAIRGDSESTGTALEVLPPSEPQVPVVSRKIVYEIACSYIPVLSPQSVGKTYLLFLAPDGTRHHWRLAPTSEQLPDPASPFGQEVLDRIRQLATQ